MLESGARFEHILEMIKVWRPDEIIAMETIGLETKRLVCFEDFYRYYLGLKGTRSLVIEYTYPGRQQNYWKS